jgi:hypothetical protein
MGRSVALSCLLLFGLVSPTWAQTPVPVFVSWHGQDSVGRQLVFEVREEIRRSRGYRLVEANEDAVLQVNVVSVDVNADNLGISSSIAVAFILRPATENRFITVAAVYLGRERTTLQARSILANVDEIATAFKKVEAKRRD